MNDPNENPFIFVGDNMALDLINTEKIERRKRIDLLDTHQDIQAWWEIVSKNYPEAEHVHGDQELVYDTVLLETVKMLREHLRRLFEKLIDGDKPDDAEITYLNRILQRGHPSLIWEQNQPKFSHQYADDPYAALLLPIALSAINLITRSDLDRLHRCHNNSCIMLFYDTTKSGTKRWCSTACMDRERSARRYREAKENSS